MAKIIKAQPHSNGQDTTVNVDQNIPVSAQLESSIKKEIKRFDPFEARLSELKEKFSGLTIVDKNDKDGYEEVRQAISQLRSIRTGTAKDKAIIKKPFLEACSTIEEKSKFIIDGVWAIEEPLQKRKDEVDAEIEEEKRLKREQQELALKTRMKQLQAMGAITDGVNVELGEVSYEITVIRESDDDIYQSKILPKYVKIFEATESMRLENERKQAEIAAEEQRKRDELLRQEKELEEKQKQFREQQEKADRENREAEEKLQLEAKEKRDSEIKRRCNQLQALGMRFIFNYDCYAFADVNVDNKTEICLLEETEWNVLIDRITLVIEERKKQIAQKDLEEKHQREEQIRQDAIKAEQDRQENLRHEEAQQKQMEELRKTEELNKASDKDKFAYFLLQLNQIHVPELKTRYWNDKLKIVLEKFEEINSL